jgi:hypothetical protein
MPGLDRVLRLARLLTGREHAGVALAGLTVPGPDALSLEHPAVARALSAGGVHEDVLAPAVLDGARSFAGVPLRPSGSASTGVLWVAGSAPAPLDGAARDALVDLAALLEAELERSGAIGLAAEVQRQLLPDHAPEAPGYDMAAACRPAQEVGGDFYDWWRTGDSLQVVVADVMGKGVPAAIVAAAVRAMLRAALTFHEPGAAFTRVGGDLQADLDHVGRFATCFAARLDVATGRLAYADAGHGLAMVLRSDGTAEPLQTDDLPLGTLPGTVWRSRQTTLAPGETLLVVSDGVLDLFEDQAIGVESAVRLHRAGANAADYVAGLDRSDLLGEPGDDLTVVAIRRQA